MATAALGSASSLVQMPFHFKAIPAILVLSFTAAALGQTAAEAPAPATAPAVVSPSAILRPALANVQSTTADLKISKWKIPGSARKAAEEDVNSIQRDLGGTLPGLLASADAAPGSVPPSFAVYRNLDALYDVLLRVSQKADLGAPSREAIAIASSLHELEAARRQLGDSILNTAQHHETRLVALESAVRAARTAPSTHRHETIINDGPAKNHERKTRRRTVHKKVPPKAAPGNPR